MRTTITLIFLFVSHLACTQSFLTKLIFEDAIGNRDSVFIGYDSLATNEYNANLDGSNLIASQISSSFGVRISDEWKVGNSTTWITGEDVQDFGSTYSRLQQSFSYPQVITFKIRASNGCGSNEYTEQIHFPYNSSPGCH